MLNILQARYKFNVFSHVCQAETLKIRKNRRELSLLEKAVASLRFERFL